MFNRRDKQPVGGGYMRQQRSLVYLSTMKNPLLVLVLVLVPVLVCVDRAQAVRCFSHFRRWSGQCDEELGEVDEDDCCQNPDYGYVTQDGGCQSCGPPAWSDWSPWSPCSVLCGEGVTQRSRKCFGMGQCQNTANVLQTQPCNGTCCDGGWASWLPWSSCSITCGGRGVRRRERLCSATPECRPTCGGSSEEAESCVSDSRCPVHGGWSSWSVWSLCSGSCIDDEHEGVSVPSRQRHRSCSSPAPSNDTWPPGDGCHGDGVQVQHCSELPKCPVDGHWGAWSEMSPCTARCGEGLRFSTRVCNQPAPKYGGRFCEGASARSVVCHIICAVDGAWSGWSSWGECTASCITKGRVPVRTRQRSCSSPAPSLFPVGEGCHGDSQQTDECVHLPSCPGDPSESDLDGGWGSWSPFSSCPVSCGVGLQVSLRRCDSPSPKAGGRPCPGNHRRTRICKTNVHCPVDGVWSEWSPWQRCEYPFKARDIRCKQIAGSQSREHRCLHRAHNGSICSGDRLSEYRICYDVSGCYLKGSWDGWEAWSLCRPPCGGNSRRRRSRKCVPDYSDYRSSMRRQKENVTFYGDPVADCGPAPGGVTFQAQPCVNVPACD
uniref:properdin-like isoform X2 n=1 Tax=Doryrhamphus excisus TaxID=161450 RepID=UPI0025AE5C7C|nr:properdin-like isoform X2 [Doryrhamphus excisus]